MEQNKDQLEALLKFIDQLGQNPDNAWFVERLRKKYANTEKRNETINNMLTENDINRLKTRISNIEKYLGLDFDIDTANSIIDYSRINDREVRVQLESDNREMLRYRYGTRSHKVDFEEFCKYAHFQAEMLLNYVYEPIPPYTIKDCTDHIKYFFPNVKFYDESSSLTISKISYYAKMVAFLGEFFSPDNIGQYNHNKLYWALKDVEDTRNNTNHRGPYDKADEKSSSKYKYEQWLSNTPFDEVIDAIRLLAKKVQEIDRTTFLSILQQWSNATILNVLPSTAFVKIENGESKQLSSQLSKELENKKKGDIIQIKMDISGNIIDIKK